MSLGQPTHPAKQWSEDGPHLWSRLESDFFKRDHLSSAAPSKPDEHKRLQILQCLQASCACTQIFLVFLLQLRYFTDGRRGNGKNQQLVCVFAQGPAGRDRTAEPTPLFLVLSADPSDSFVFVFGLNVTRLTSMRASEPVSSRHVTSPMRINRVCLSLCGGIMSTGLKHWTSSICTACLQKTTPLIVVIARSVCRI